VGADKLRKRHRTGAPHGRDRVWDQGTIAIFHVKAKGVYVTNWDVPWDAPKTDSLLHVLGWTRQTLRTLQEKLAQVDCISIASGEPSTIGYQRSGLGKYSFQFFARPATDSVKRQYCRSCTYIFYKPRVVLEYGGGAVGPQFWPPDMKSKPPPRELTLSQQGSRGLRKTLPKRVAPKVDTKCVSSAH
jgi:hypothetical protein